VVGCRSGCFKKEDAAASLGFDIVRFSRKVADSKLNPRFYGNQYGFCPKTFPFPRRRAVLQLAACRRKSVGPSLSIGCKLVRPAHRADTHIGTNPIVQIDQLSNFLRRQIGADRLAVGMAPVSGALRDFRIPLRRLLKGDLYRGSKAGDNLHHISVK
jgi:hypothetical protein